VHINKPNFFCKVHEDNQSTIRMATSDNRGGIDKNLRKNISSNINLKYGNCRYVHAE
jgi:hypothetical protein